MSKNLPPDCFDFPGHETQAGGPFTHPATPPRKTDRPDAPGLTAELRRRWLALRDGQAVPERADVTAAGMGPVLDYAFILERIAPGSARMRLAGRNMIAVMGCEARGMPISSVLNPAWRGRFSDILETVFQGPQLAELSLFAPADCHGNPACPARMLLLPLRSDLGDVSRILGCLVTETRVTSPPRRFDLMGESFEPVIKGAPTLWPGADPMTEGHPARAAQDMAFAEWGITADHGLSRGAAPNGALRLVVDNAPDP